MTNGWIDIKNTDMMLIMGGNPAENHPCGFKWAMEAKRNRNAKLISVDPRFTRTSSTADLFLQIRAGADIAFLGGLIRYAIENNRIAKEYLVNYTNAAFVVKEGFKLPEDGLYSGFDSAARTYDKTTWNYEEGGDMTGKADTGGACRIRARPAPAAPPPLPPNVAYDLTLQHPRCVFQLLKQQYSRYTPEMVERITGIPQGPVPEGRRSVHVHSQGRRHEESGDDHLRRRLDAAHLRNADHPHGGDDAAAAGQRGPGGRRRQRVARPFEYSGRHGHGRHFRQLAGISEGARPDGCGLGGLSEAHHADIVEARSLGFVQLLVEHAEVCGVAAEVDVWRCRDEGKRLRLRLSCRKSTATIPGRTSGTTCTAAR